MKMNPQNSQKWPPLPYIDWKDTLETLHLWTQIVGKIRLKEMPWTNHQWHVTLYVSPIGLTTGSMPCEKGVFQIDFDFLQHRLVITTSAGQTVQLELRPYSVADFYYELFDQLHSLGINVKIYAVPNEMEPAIPFAEDTKAREYDPEKVSLFWQAIVSMYPTFLKYRAEFTGKSSPVHFFWGSFDLAVSRFSGKEAPPYSGSLVHISRKVMQEAYSHEVCSCGFWPGSEYFPEPAFYAYLYPAPADYSNQKIVPGKAFYSKEMGEYLLRYEDVRQSENPEDTLLQFMNSTYELAANTAGWDRAKLDFKFKP
jgi:hypothetical protein